MGDARARAVRPEGRVSVSPRRSSRGSSLLEVSAAVALVGVLVAVSVPMVGRTMRRNELRRASRTVQASIERARGLAVSGKRSESDWGPTDRAVSAGLRVTGPDALELFVDRDGITDGDEVAVGTVTLPRAVVLQAPAVGAEVRFRQDGTLAAPSGLVLKDVEGGSTRTITITAGGSVRVE